MARALRLEDYLPPDPMFLDEKDEEILKDLGKAVVEAPRPRAGGRYVAAVLRTEQSVDELRTSLEQVVEAAEREIPRGELDVQAALEQLRRLEDDVRLRRDCRWQLLALRAKAEDEKGEVFTNADDLLQHLHRP